MFTVQNDWIEYEEVERAAVQLQPVPARRVAVRGGAACAQRVPVVSAPRRRSRRRSARPSVPLRPRAPAAGAARAGCG